MAALGGIHPSSSRSAQPRSTEPPCRDQDRLCILFRGRPPEYYVWLWVDDDLVFSGGLQSPSEHVVYAGSPSRATPHLRFELRFTTRDGTSDAAGSWDVDLSDRKHRQIWVFGELPRPPAPRLILHRFEEPDLPPM